MPKAKTKADQLDVPQRRQPLDPEKKREMMAVVVRNEAAYAAVHDLLTVPHVTRWSRGLGLVWDVVRKMHAQYGSLPAGDMLVAEIHDRIGANPDILAHEEREEVDEFLEYAWDGKEHGKEVAKSKAHVAFAVNTCRLLLEEHVAFDARAELVNTDGVPTAISAIFDKHRVGLDQAQSLTEYQVDLPFPEGWDNQPNQQLTTTGVAALDGFTGGGLRGGEVLLFMAPYGSCKTTTACHGAANQLEHAAKLVATGAARKNKAGKPMTPVVVFIFTESDKAEYRHRLMSNMAKVPWKRLAQMSSLAALDDSDKAGALPDTKYEKAAFKNDIANDCEWFPEQERVRKAALKANKHLMILDCTDSDDSPFRIGAGGIAEIANVVRGIFRKRTDAYPIAFWLDHLSGLVDRMTDAMDTYDDAVTRRLLTNAPRIAADKLGKPFNAQVVLMHQLAGAVQNRSAVARFHHGDAEGSRSIGKYAVFAVNGGTVTDQGMCLWTCSKHRREPPTKDKIVQIVGRFNQIRDRSGSYTIDPASRTIMKKSEIGSLSSVKGPKPGGEVENKYAATKNV